MELRITCDTTKAHHCKLAIKTNETEKPNQKLELKLGQYHVGRRPLIRKQKTP